MSDELKSVVEALLFGSEKVLTTKDLQKILRQSAEVEPGPATEALRETKEEGLLEVIAELRTDYEAQGRSLMIQEVAGGYQLVTKPDVEPWLRVLFDVAPKAQRLSQPALETLAIIAFRQPITRAEVEAVRGVAVDGVMATLLERQMISISGRSETAGRPLQYSTTPQFLEVFGLKSLADLPHADELRRLEKPLQGELSATDEKIETTSAATEDRPVGSADVETAERADETV
jgi:segregation and condensation protein B